MESDEKPKRIKVGFEITEFMSKDIDRLYKELGYNDRAEFMRDAIREDAIISKKRFERSLSGYSSRTPFMGRLNKYDFLETANIGPLMLYSPAITK
jgi:hypothetical protein